MRVYHLLIAIILLALSPLIFKSVFKKAPSSNETKPPVLSPTVSPNSKSEITPQVQTVVGFKPIEGNVWKRILGKTSAPTGWNVAPCEGDAPFLCVSAEGKNLGSVEMLIYPLQTQPKLQKLLASHSIRNHNNIDFPNPLSQEKVLLALNTWIADDYIALSKDRQKEYTDKINFSGYPPQTVTVGKLQGVRYGFAGLKRQGGIQEQYLKYVAVDENSVYVINTAFDPRAATGKFDKYENLAVFEPFLSAIAANLKLPS
ncbi:hypothetical protein NIES4101_60080 [Calothrix sp. NIES-4101]|nr:hypothetical protein NIES4101_60080 [Calothrix sp. NIES-4101]